MSEAHLAIAPQPVPEVHAVGQPRSENTARVELQVPEALVRALLMEEERDSGSVALRVPAALLTTLAAEDWSQLP